MSFHLFIGLPSGHFLGSLPAKKSVCSTYYLYCGNMPTQLAMVTYILLSCRRYITCFKQKADVTLCSLVDSYVLEGFSALKHQYNCCEYLRSALRSVTYFLLL